MDASTWLDYVTAIGAVATPLLVLLLTAAGWRIRSRLERRFALEDKLRDDRIVTYNKILEPYMIMLMSDAAWQSDPKNKGKDKGDVAAAKMLSLEYRQEGFRLSLFGSDKVVRSYNDLMQYFFLRAPDKTTSEADITDLMGLLGSFLLEIRRSVGNEATQLDSWDMLEWFLTDARRFRAQSSP